MTKLNNQEKTHEKWEIYSLIVFISCFIVYFLTFFWTYFLFNLNLFSYIFTHCVDFLSQINKTAQMSFTVEMFQDENEVNQQLLMLKMNEQIRQKL